MLLLLLSLNEVLGGRFKDLSDILLFMLLFIKCYNYTKRLDISCEVILTK